MDDGLSEEMREQLPLMAAYWREIERLRGENERLRERAARMQPGTYPIEVSIGVKVYTHIRAGEWRAQEE